MQVARVFQCDLVWNCSSWEVVFDIEEHSAPRLTGWETQYAMNIRVSCEAWYCEGCQHRGMSGWTITKPFSEYCFVYTTQRLAQPCRCSVGPRVLRAFAFTVCPVIAWLYVVYDSFQHSCQFLAELRRRVFQANASNQVLKLCGPKPIEIPR